MNGEKKKAVVLHSGGIDSTRTIAIAMKDGFEPYAMTFNYGQRNIYEIRAARHICEAMEIKHRREVTIDLRQFGGSALTDNIAVPKNRSESEITGNIPVTYVPARNTIFLSYALGWAEVLGSHDIYIGVTAVDYSGYPDCGLKFFDLFRKVIGEGTKYGRYLKIYAPFMDKKKSEIKM